MPLHMQQHPPPPSDPDSISATQYPQYGEDGPPPWGESDRLPGDSGRPRGFTVLAWLVIAMVCAAAIILPRLEGAPAPSQTDEMGILLMRVQSQYFVGAGNFMPAEQRTQMYDEARKNLNRGTVPQRQRFIALAAEMQDPAEARERLHELDELIRKRKDEQPPEGQPPFELTESQRAVQALLHVLYNHKDIDSPRIDALTENERDQLRAELGWFGELAFAHSTVASDAERKDVLRPANRVVLILLSSAVSFVVAAIVGGIALILWTAFLVSRRTRLHFSLRAGHHHGIYAETFALWMVIFFGLQLLPEFVPALGTLGMSYVLLMFFVSLIVLGWPVMRGVPWTQVCEDVGLTRGRSIVLETLNGGLGYLMALPIAIVGILLVFILMMLESLLRGTPDAMGPTGGPAHPILGEIAAGNWSARLQLLAIAAVAAPVVEEIMFRGVFYRHLREFSRTLGLAGSVVLSGLLNAFIFAVIHPQGFVAVPALMALAAAFVLLREWRDTVIPAIVMHGISNAIIVTLMILVLSA